MNEADWAITEFGAAAMGDKRRTDRLVAAATVLGEHPQESLPEACGDPAMLKGVYRWLGNEAVTPAAILASHVQATLERVSGAAVVLAVQDTTELDYSAHKATSGLGAIGNGYGRGLEVHSTLAVSPEGVPQGPLAQETWTRDPAATGKKHQRKQRPLDRKESAKWLRGLATLNAVAGQCPQAHFLSVADREADVFDLFCAPRAANVGLLIRAAQNRQVGEAGGTGPLRATLLRQPAGATRTVEVPRRGTQPARAATVWVRWGTLTFRPPANRPAGSLPAVSLWAVWAHEDQPPAGAPALDWLLLTTLPIPDQAAADRCLAYYACRFVIETWHRTLKTGCALEARQLASREALCRPAGPDHPGRALHRPAGGGGMAGPGLSPAADHPGARHAAHAGRGGALDCPAGRLPGPPRRW